MLPPLVNVAKRHPLLTFFALACALSWGNLVASAIWPGFPFLYPYGSLFAAIIVASITQGKAGLKDLLNRCLRWRVSLKWYAAALLVPVAIALVTVAFNLLLGASIAPTAQLVPWYSFFFLFPLAMLDAPLGEDSGWRGYAMPRFPAGRSPLVNSLILGVILAVWHAPLVLMEPDLAAPYLITTIASAVITNWVYYNAGESALLAILYHTAANTMGGAGLNVFQMFSGPDFTRVWWLLAVVNWAAVVIIVLVAGASLGYRPVQPKPMGEPVAEV